VSNTVYTSQLKNSNTQHTSDLNLTSYRREIMISNMYHVALLQLARHPLSYVLRAAPVYRMEFYIDRSTPNRLALFLFFPVYLKNLHTAQNVPDHHGLRVWCLMSPSQPDGFVFFGSSNGQIVPTRAGQNRCWSPWCAAATSVRPGAVCSLVVCVNVMSASRTASFALPHTRALQPKTDCMRPLSTMANKSSGQSNTPSRI
jgi:hypothetical protein